VFDLICCLLRSEMTVKRSAWLMLMSHVSHIVSLALSLILHVALSSGLPSCVQIRFCSVKSITQRTCCLTGCDCRSQWLRHVHVVSTAHHRPVITPHPLVTQWSAAMVLLADNAMPPLIFDVTSRSSLASYAYYNVIGEIRKKHRSGVCVFSRTPQSSVLNMEIVRPSVFLLYSHIA